MSRLVAVTGSLAVGMGLLATPALAAEGPDLDEPYRWVEEFDSWEALDGWNIFNQPDYNNDDALYTSYQIEVPLEAYGDDDEDDDEDDLEEFVLDDDED